jgi:hypothetical protein
MPTPAFAPKIVSTFRLVRRGTSGERVGVSAFGVRRAFGRKRGSAALDVFCEPEVAGVVVTKDPAQKLPILNSEF